MQVADEVTERVRAELKEARRVQFTTLQKLGAAFVGLLTASALIVQMLAAAGYIG